LVISELFTVSVIVGIAHSGIRLATPYLFASLGEMFGQRSGVLNLGVDGIMLMGAFAAFYTVFETGNLRILLPVRAKMALVMAGIVGGRAGSPAPPGSSVLATMCTSTSGISSMRRSW